MRSGYLPWRRRATRAASRAANWLRLIGKPSHRANIARAERVIAKLQDSPPGQALTYLRKVHPNVVEELVLTLFERAGYFVLRNLAYSGDGGLDGQIYWPGRNSGWVVIQTKRYSQSIDPGHVREFAQLVKSQWIGGIFVHTGRTGPMSHEAASGGRVHFLSGSGLCAAIQGANPLALLMIARKQPKAR